MGASGEVWAPENEIHLFHAMQKYKPVGMHKHVRMFNIHRFVNEHAKAPISVEQIWERINDMYDIQLLDELAEEDSEGEHEEDEPIEFWLPSDFLEESTRASQTSRRTQSGSPSQEQLDDTEERKEGMRRSSRAGTTASTAATASALGTSKQSTAEPTSPAVTSPAPSRTPETATASGRRKRRGSESSSAAPTTPSAQPTKKTRRN